MLKSLSVFLAPAVGVLAVSALSTTGATITPVAAQAPPHTGPLFQSAANCMVCHNGLTTPTGEDVSFGSTWRASMMAHSARDPYWQAAVRRETIDHPTAKSAIENECSRCHMPMANVASRVAGVPQSVFDHIVGAGGLPPTANPLAVEGVSCTVCHQITGDGLGTPSSFTGGFVIDTTTPADERRMFGPFEIDAGRAALMRSATAVQPAEALHIQRSEMCATCHTLITHTLNAAGEPIAELPEQVPYQEWLHSEYRETQSCQACHMPVVAEPTPIVSVLGEPRQGLSRHDFRGANFFMLGLFNRYRNELAVTARPHELDAAVARTKTFLESHTARVEVERLVLAGTRLEADVAVSNLAGHKLPTAYPSRRAWLRVTVLDADGRVVFVSGRLDQRGAIEGNDNDGDPLQYEPHYNEIRAADQVQIYESIMVDAKNAVTTGLLSGMRYVKDNRLLPRGFDKATAPADVAVHGAASKDGDFGGGRDRVRYVVEVGAARAPFTVEAELWYQPIGYRWAYNLGKYDTFETGRFVSYYKAMAPSSATILARVSRATGS
jgi:hypothetical protein